MKLSANSTVFNMGDTSFRRKTLLDDYKEILIYLRDHKEDYPVWQRNNEAQGAFYNTVMEHSELFERTKSTDSSKRGRTLTNALIKPGLINKKRELGEVANNWIDDNTKNADMLEQLLSLSIDNLIFLRQWFKLRVYANNGKDYFYPFRVALKLLDKYKDIPENQLLDILHMIDPVSATEENLKEIIANYYQVKNNNMTFEEFQEEFLSTYDTEEELLRAKMIMSTNDYASEADFNALFTNRKSAKSQEEYYEFYKRLLDFKNNKNAETLTRLTEYSKIASIKKGFGFNKIPFDIPNKLQLSVEEFIKLNKGHLLLSEDNTKIYTQFVLSKKSDLIREYSDMTKRSFNLSGIISFDQGLVNLTQPWLFSKVFSELDNQITLSGREKYKDYELNIESSFYQDLTLMNIIELSATKVQKIILSLQEEFNIDDVTSLIQVVEQDKEDRFRSVIEKEFNKTKIIDLLPLFSERDDTNIKKQVTDSATVPTIFEYIIAIAWYHISDENYPILKSLNLTLDGDFKPLTHATGGAGDIVMDYPDLTLMLEATLMDKNSQKRGELEPVIRHATNLTVERTNDVFTIFIADELDNNVINIFRSMTKVELESTQQKGTTEKVDIFALSVSEIRTFLEKDIKSNKIVNILQESYMENNNPIKIGWRNEILTEIMN